MASVLPTPAQRIAAGLADDLELVFTGHLMAASAVMSPDEISSLLATTATNVGKAAMLYALRNKHESRSSDQVCTCTEALIAQMLRDGRPHVIAKFEALEAAEAEIG